MNDLNMNRLPVATWNQCGVNSAPRAAALPELSGDFWGEVNFAYTLPAGVGKPRATFLPLLRAAWVLRRTLISLRMPRSATR